MKIYKYVGKGAGVPGLPHRISEEKAQKRGLVEKLEQAVQVGTYAVEVEDQPATESKPRRKKSKEQPEAPETGEGEVNG